MAEAIAGSLLGKLQDVAVSEAMAQLDMKNGIRRLSDRLVWLQAFVEELDPIMRVDGNLLTGVLVRQTRAVAMDSEDAIDSYLWVSDTISSRHGCWRVPKLLQRFAQHVLVRFYLSHEITTLNERIEEILSSREKYKLDGLRTGLEDAGTSTPEPWALPTGHGLFNQHIPRRTRFEENWCDHPCRDGDKKDLIEYLLEVEEVFVIFMGGDSGVGKTALVRSVYNDTKIVGQFHVRIWIDMPPNTLDTTIGSQIKQILGVACSATHNDSTSSPRRLVVIDCNDVRFTGQEMSEWIPDAGKHDKIVLITSKTVPTAMLGQQIKHGDIERGAFLLSPSSLVKKDVWLLFHFKLLGVPAPIGSKSTEEQGKGSSQKEEEKGSSQNEEGKDSSQKEEERGSTSPALEEKEGKSDLVSKLQEVTTGLPRAVVMLAHLLRSTEKSSWGSLFQYICRSSKVERRLQRILLLSFNALPNDLKPCFLYFAGFPQETEICTQELVRLWVAEGFLCPKDGKSMEFIGHGHLKELISRDLVQVVTKDDIGFVQSVAIPSYVLDFLRMEARESSFLDVHHLYNVPNAATVRRLSILDYKSESSAFDNEYPKLRSLISKEKPKEQDNFQHTVQSQPGDGEEDPLLPRRYNEDALLWMSQPALTITNRDATNEDRTNNFLHTVQTQLGDSEEDPLLPRRNNEDALPWTPQLALNTSGRTLTNRDATNEDRTKSISKVLRGSPYLRVISLEGHNVGKKMLRCISDKGQLCYLRVKSTNLTTIPGSIGDLPRLQTLDVRGTKIRKLPDEFWKIETLRHVLGDGLSFPNPASANNLRNLQTLETMSLDGIDKWDGQIMSKMLNLETLTVKGIHVSPDISPALHQLINLKRLRLHGGKIELRSMGLDNHNLVLMELSGELKAPEDVDFMKTSKLFNLSVLKLRNTLVHQGFINNISHLPNLKHLSLLDNSCAVEELEIPNSGFQVLEELKVSVSRFNRLKKIIVNGTRSFRLISCVEITIGGENQDFQQPKPSFSGRRNIDFQQPASITSGERCVYSIGSS